MASTAAGTSIGISLVPPLCASGYGLGTVTWSIASGAGLLFLTNFVAIVVVATLTFAAAGFGQVDSATLEREELSGSSSGRTLARALAGAFASRGGSWLRLAMPLALLCAVYVPLRRALDDLVWQVKVRSTVESALTKLPSRVVQSSIQIRGGEVALGLLVLGNTTDAQHSQALLTDLLQRAGIRSQLEIAAVPDASSFARLEAKMRTPSAPSIPLPQVVDPVLELDAVRAAVWSAVERRWPRQSAGPVLSVAIEARTGAVLYLRLVHLGVQLEPATRELLERVVGEDLRRSVRIADAALPPDEMAFDVDSPAAFVKLASVLEIAAALPQVNTCAVGPPQGGSRGRRSALSRFDGEMRAALASHPRTTPSNGPRWSVRFTLTDCTQPKPDPKPSQ
jgi:hypothetical protein